MEKTLMKLSIIVPVYNVLPYIRQCLDSLINQTLEDYEILLVDDGSTDGTAAVLEEYRDRYPELIRLRRVDNGGQGRARNFAIPEARGKFLGFIDSDDSIAPDMYEKLIARAEETGADVAVCDWLARYDDGREEVLPACVQEHPLAAAGSACNKVFRRELVGDIRFPVGLWYEDFYFSALMLIRANKIEYVKEPLYIYRMHQASTMRNNNSAKNLDLLKIMDMLAEHMLPEHREEFEFFLINHVLLDAVSRVSRQRTPDRDEVLSLLRAYVREKIPDLGSCVCYRRESRNRRLVMRLNYMGLDRLAIGLLDMKSKISK